MSDIDIKIKSTFDSAGTDAARKGVEGLGKSGAGMEKLGAAAIKAATDHERLSQAVAKTATATTQAATAAQKLATEEQRTAAAAQTRAEKAALSLAQANAKAAQSATSAGSYFTQMGAAMQSSLLGVIGPAAAVGTAMAALKGAVDLAGAAEQAGRVEGSFNKLAVAAGTTGSALMTALRSASGGEISDLNLQLAANKANLLGVADSAQEFSVLMQIARDRAAAMGISTTQAFDNLVTGLGRGSALILDNLGIMVKESEIYDTYAASVGKSAAALTDAEKKHALINSVIAQGQATLQASSSAIDDHANRVAKAATAWENFKIKAGQAALVAVGPALDNATKGLSVPEERQAAGVDAITKADDWKSYQAAVQAANAELLKAHGTYHGMQATVTSITEAQFNYAKALMETGVGAEQARARAESIGPVLNTLSTAAASGADGMQQLDASAQQVAATIPGGEAAVVSLATAWQLGGLTAAQFQAALDALILRNQSSTGPVMQAADAEDRRANSLRMGTSAAFENAAATMAKTAADQNAQAQTALLEAQVKSVAESYMALNPNIDGAGVASAVAAGKISAAVGQYINMTIATANARAQLAALQNQAGVTPGGGVTEGRSERDTGADRAEAAAGGKALMRRQADEAAAAKRSQVMAAGTTAQKIALLNQEYAAAVAGHGKESAAAITAQTALLQAQQSGATKRGNAAATAATKLEGIEQKTGDKLTDIVSKTQDKLIAIDNKAAEARLAAAKRLNQALATNAVDRRAANEADDLDLIGPMDEKAAAKLNDRERAQASAREREKAAAAEAQAGIARGEAETAEKVYAAREEQIQARQQLDENYYARQRELADDPGAQAALTQQYDEAVRAADEAAQLRIQFAQAAAEEAAGAAAEEKARIIAEAEEQANQVIGASERSAAGVKKATASARDEAIASIRAIGDSINALPAEKRIKISVDGSGGVSTAAAGKSDGAYAGGGSFMTQGPTTITVGDNPGGAELVTVTPLSGSGQTRAAAGTIALAGGGSVLADAGDGYTTPVAGTGSSAKKGRGKGGAATAAAAKDQIAEQKAAIDLLSDLIKLRHDMAAELENGTPFDVAFAERLSTVAAEFARFVRAALPSATKAETEAFKLSADNTKQSIGILSEMVDLRKDLSDWQSVNPIDLAFVQRLAATAAEVTRLVMSQLVPTTELEVDRLERWAALEGAAVGLISDVTKLNQRMFSDYVPPSDAQLDMVVKDADRIADRMIVAAKKYDTKGLEAAKLYGDALGGFYSTAKDALLFNQAINSGDFDQNQANLDKFERSASVAIGVAKRLGAEAATIPSTDLAALQLTTQALASQSEALIKLAAVPFGDLPGAAANLQSQAAQLLGGSKGGGAITNIYNTFQLPSGTPAQLAELVIQRLGQQVNSRK